MIMEVAQAVLRTVLIADQYDGSKEEFEQIRAIPSSQPPA